MHSWARLLAPGSLVPFFHLAICCLVIPVRSDSSFMLMFPSSIMPFILLQMSIIDLRFLFDVPIVTYILHFVLTGNINVTIL